MRRGTTRVIHFPGNEGYFAESKTMICQTNMAKGAWGRPCGGVFLVPLGAGNKRGGLRIYHSYRRHLFKLFTAFKAGRTPLFATAKQLCQRRQKKSHPKKFNCPVVGTWGSQIYPSELLLRDARQHTPFYKDWVYDGLSILSSTGWIRSK